MALNNQMTKLFGAFILVLIGTALMPTIFTQVADMAGVDSDVPAWLVTALTVVVGAGLLFLIWRAVE